MGALRIPRVALVAAVGATLACGARSFLSVADLGPQSAAPDPTPARTGPLRIAFFGMSGSYDEGALLNFLQAFPATVARLATNSSPVTEDVLADYDIVILDRLTRRFAASEAAALQTWVHDGGAVMALTGFVNSPQDADLPNSLLAAFPLRYESTFVVLTTPAPIIVSSFASSPVTAQLKNVPFWGGHRVSITASCDGATLAVAFEEGGPVGAICRHGAGRLYLWGDEWVEYTSEWTTATDTALFWQEAISWLAAR